MDLLQKSLDKAIRLQLESANSEKELERISEAVPDMLVNLLDSLPNDILRTIKVTAEEGLAERRSYNDEFVNRNVLRWKEGFELLELQIEIAIEAGESFNDRLRPKAVLEGNLVFDLLIRLHAKGCLISKEIFTLLRNGYADGAQARWRSLHEITVTAMFLLAHGEKAAKRYVDHEFVETYDAAKKLNQFASRLNIPKYSEEELKQSKFQHDAVLNSYGTDFANQYGWAAPFLSDKNKTFAALEKAVGLDHWRPYYKWACQNIHANIKTISDSLGLNEAVEDILQVGPSNSGMADPAQHTAISLSQLTSALLLSNPNVDGIVMTKILSSLSDEMGKVFVMCNERKSV